MHLVRMMSNFYLQNNVVIVVVVALVTLLFNTITVKELCFINSGLAA